VTAIRVLIADDHPVTREGLRAALDLADDIVIVGVADCGETAIERAGELTPDIVFMDADMPGIGGIEAAKEIKRAAPEIRVILLTGNEARATASAAIEARVSGYLLKDADADELVNAARLAFEGRVVIHPALVPKLIQELQRETRVESPMDEGSEPVLRPFTVTRALANIFLKIDSDCRDETMRSSRRSGIAIR
jgi:DNA-binding NarL/FixJ family response regulator